MHEMGIAASVLDIVRDHVPDARGGQVRRVYVRVGELSGVQPDSLAFCFEAIVQGTPFRRARMVVERVPAVRACRTCGTRFAHGAPLTACPGCGGVDAPLVSGDELMVSEVELDERVEARVAS